MSFAPSLFKQVNTTRCEQEHAIIDEGIRTAARQKMQLSPILPITAALTKILVQWGTVPKYNFISDEAEGIFDKYRAHDQDYIAPESIHETLRDLGFLIPTNGDALSGFLIGAFLSKVDVLKEGLTNLPVSLLAVAYQIVFFQHFYNTFRSDLVVWRQ